MSQDVLLIHGAFNRGRSLERLAGAFESENWRCHRPDLPYHGEHIAGQKPHPELASQSLTNYRDFLRREANKLESKPIVVGHSMGGLLALMLAAAGAARAAILLTPATPWGFPPMTWHQLKAKMGLMNAGAFWKRGLRPSRRLIRNDALNLLTDEQVEDELDHFVPESGRVLFEMLFWHLDQRCASFVHLDAVRCPVLVIGAAHDRVTPAVSCRQLALRMWRTAEYRQFDDNGHWLVGEPGWEAVAEACLDWTAHLNVRERGY